MLQWLGKPDRIGIESVLAGFLHGAAVGVYLDNLNYVHNYMQARKKRKINWKRRVKIKGKKD